MAVVLAGLFLIGIPICQITGCAVGEADHGGIVWDEIVAYAMVLACLPHQPGWWLAGFVAFRWFDITKPYPIDRVDDQLKNGFGVMLDDLLAAGYAVISLLSIKYCLSYSGLGWWPVG